jgi:hypothetical protein
MVKGTTLGPGNLPGFFLSKPPEIFLTEMPGDIQN